MRSRALHVLHVNKFLYRRGGAESYMLDVAQLQRTAGDEVSFWSMEHPDNQPDPNGDTFAPRMELNPPPPGLRGRVTSAAGVIYRPSARAGIEEVLDRVRPDVVHLHNVYHQLSPSILRPLARRGVPAVMTLHDYKLVCPTYQFLDHGKICEACLPRKFHQAARRRCNRGSLSGSLLASVEMTLHTAFRAYGAVDVFVCPSDFMRRKMTEGEVYPDRLVHVPHFADLSVIAPAEEPGSGVLFAGRLSPEKGVDVLLRAMTHLPDVELTVAGDGPDRAVLEQLAADLGLGPRVRFLGRVPGAEVHRLMRAAAVVTLPARWYENQPMTVLEAFGAARPVVASDLGGLPELIADGETGRLVPHDDAVALAGALGELAHDPAKAHAWGLEARQRASSAFAIDTHLAALRDVYARAAAHKKDAA